VTGAAALAFAEAHEPPEARGIPRDGVRLMVASRATGAIDHRHFAELAEVLWPGDVLVVNTSATLPAAVDTADGARQVRFSTPAPGMGPDWRVVEVRSAGGVAPVTDAHAGTVALTGGAALELHAPYAGSARLWLARLEVESFSAYLRAHGKPIRYAYVPREWPLADYQTAFAVPAGDGAGSAEMPSAARPFTPALIARLVSRGIGFAPITLHTGVSSPERHEPPYAEPFAVSEPTARLVNATRRAGRRVIAVGTTAVRALETVADDAGTIRAASGWTDLVVTPDHPIHAVDGLITGWHEPLASHLDLLTAIAGPDLLEVSYTAAMSGNYLWHEFGDSHLVLP
jgi:S-adenosylmethionine:tRNA-ribosyltransferase-isomerase (queuine synthetase)